jgi:NRAMP (natural resistance-associated macrophage protein)-like metal ion transporter
MPARGWLARLGPGLITGASDDDPSGIATYSQVGSQFGFAFLWTMVLSYPLMAGIQEISARVGLVTGRGLAANLRAHFPPALLHAVVLLLLVANVVNIGADIGAMAAAIRMLVGGPATIYIVGVGALSVGLQVFIPYRRYVPYLKWLCVSLLAYVGVVFVVTLPWGRVLLATLVPSVEWSTAAITAMVAIFGTTISPYLFFWQAAEEVEEQKLAPMSPPLKQAPRRTAIAELDRMRADTWFGMAVSNVVGFFVILTAAAVFNANGVTNIQTTSQAAEALRPAAGRLAYLLFALGMVGTGLLAVPVLAGSSAYAIGEAYRWPVGLEKKPRRAPLFYATIAFSTFAGVLLNVTHVDPIKALFWSAVVNGVASAPIMIVIMLLANGRRVMGAFRLPLRLRVLGWSATGLMTISASALLGLLGLPLLSHVSRGGSVGAAHEQSVGTTYQEMGVFEGFENEPACVPFEARQRRRLTDRELSARFLEKNSSQSCDAVADPGHSAHQALLCHRAARNRRARPRRVRMPGKAPDQPADW